MCGMVPHMSRAGVCLRGGVHPWIEANDAAGLPVAW